jgi:predicted Zn finger-like uncharacterized protein
MKIVCDSCGAKYSIADEKVAGKIFKIRCKKCSSVLEVRGDQTGSHPFADTGGQEPAGEATWYIVVDGEQKGPLPPVELSRLFAKGSVGLDSYVWKEGFDDWKVASDVPELNAIFGGGSAASGGTAPGSDDTSSFGTSGDLFAGGGREPTSEIDTENGMFSGFDESPTPSNNETEQSPLAASAAADSSEALGGAALGGGAMAGASPQRMTGQRNENSVLFSLSNLQQLASRGGAGEAAPAATSQPAAMGSTANTAPAAGEGSGLIDIRALAKSTTPGTQAAPTQAVDDLLAIGTGGAGGTLGTPLLGPAPLETSDGHRWLWIAGAAVAVIAIVGAGVGVGMALGGSDDDALEIAAPSAGTQAAQPLPGQPTPVQAAPGAEAEPEPEAAEAAVVDIEPEEPVAAATIEEPKNAEPATRTATKERSTARRRPTSARSKPAPRTSTPKPKSNNLDALMDEVVGGKPSSQPRQASTASSPSNSSLPDAPSRDDVKTALQGVSGAVKACRQDAGGTATVNVTFSGKTGRATGAKVASGPFKGTPVGSCIENAVKRARVPRFKQSSFKVTFPYRL